MNRQQRRRTKEVKDTYTESYKSAVIIMGVVLVIVLLFYLITVVINNKNRRLNTVTPDETTEIQFKEILAEHTFTMNDPDYYVLFYDKTSVDDSYYEFLINYSGLKVYTVDLSKAFNKKYIGEKTNKKAKDASTLTVKDPTIIEIKDGKNVKYVEGSKEDVSKVLSRENM